MSKYITLKSIDLCSLSLSFEINPIKLKIKLIKNLISELNNTQILSKIMLGRLILTCNLCEASILRVGMKQYLRKRTHARTLWHVTEWSECLSDMQLIFVVIMLRCLCNYFMKRFFHKMEIFSNSPTS